MRITDAAHGKLPSEQTSSICMQSAQRNEFVRPPCASGMVSCLIVPPSSGKGRVGHGVKVVAKRIEHRLYQTPGDLEFHLRPAEKPRREPNSIAAAGFLYAD
jgi:hypothetical protein